MSVHGLADESVRSRNPLEVFLRGGPSAIALLATLCLVAAFAWVAVIWSAAGMGSAMVAMTVTSDNPAGVALFLLTWLVMMVAMMLPASAPVVQAYANYAAATEGGGRRATSKVVVFLGIYFLVWTLFGLGVAGLYFLLSGRLGDLAQSGTLGPSITGSLLVVAGVYQATPLKQVCLSACRSPLHLFLTNHAKGFRGALNIGLRHSAHCVGCCWLMFIVLFAVGVMSIPWMALLSVVIFVEKGLPGGSKASYVIGALFILIGVFFLLGAPLGTFAHL